MVKKQVKRFSAYFKRRVSCTKLVDMCGAHVPMEVYVAFPMGTLQKVYLSISVCVHEHVHKLGFVMLIAVNF